MKSCSYIKENPFFRSFDIDRRLNGNINATGKVTLFLLKKLVVKAVLM